MRRLKSSRLTSC